MTKAHTRTDIGTDQKPARERIGGMSPHAFLPAAPGILAAGRRLLVDLRMRYRTALFLLVVVVILGGIRSGVGEKHFDFGVYYYASRMCWDGESGHLYDLEAQRDAQLRYGRPKELLFYYPPFVLLPFLPLATMSPTAAYYTWNAISITTLAISIRALSKRLGIQHGDWPLLVAVSSMPVVSALLHGQLSLVVLSAYIYSYLLISSGRRFASGLALAVALLKFQLVVGFACIMLIRRKWHELAGLTCGGVCLAIASLVLVGPSALAKFPQFLFAAEAGPGANPLSMANLRGLAYSLLGTPPPVLVIFGLSAAIVYAASRLWRDNELGFASGVLAATLVSYHLNPQDLSLLILPLFLLLRNVSRIKTLIILGLAHLGTWIPPYLFGVENVSKLATLVIALFAWATWRYSTETKAAGVAARALS